MNPWEQALYVIDEVILGDTQQRDLNWQSIQAQLETIGPQIVHRTYYDGGLFSQSIIQETLRTYPNGFLHQLLTWLVQQKQGEYTVETLRGMYRLST